MPKDTPPGKPTTRRYSAEEKAAAVRMVRTLRAELGTEHGTVHRVAAQLGTQRPNHSYRSGLLLSAVAPSRRLPRRGVLRHESILVSKR